MNSSEEKKNILIFDDDIQTAEMLAEYLKVACNAETCLAHLEDDFWKAYQPEDLDIIFLDYRLSDQFSGIDILKKLTEKENTVPVVMMTGEGSEETAVEAMQNGAFDYLVKGKYEFSQINNLIEKAVRFRTLEAQNRKSLNHIKYQSNLIDNMRDAVVAWNMLGEITYWNRTAETLFGHSAAAHIGKQAKQSYWPLFQPAIQINTEQKETERKLTKPDGSTIWISSRITPLFGENSQPMGYMDICRDITARKKEQQEHNETRHFLERVIDSSPDLVFIFSLASGKVTFISPNVKSLLGYSPQEIYTKGERILYEVIHSDDLPFINEQVKMYSKPNPPATPPIEYRIKAKSGKYHWFSGHDGVFTKTDAGIVTEIICIVHNIDDKKKTEYQLQQRLVTEKLLSSISNFFINLSAENTDVGVDKTFLLIGNFVRPDYGAIYLLNEDQNFEYYCGFEKTKIIDKIKAIRSKDIPWLFKTLQEQNNLQIDHLDELPNQAFKEKLFFDDLGIRAIIFIPMVYNNELLGAIALFKQNTDTPWMNNHTYMLQSFAEMVSNALVQKRVEEALRDSETRYRAIVDEHQTEMIFRMESDLAFSFVNETFAHYNLATKEDLLGKPFLASIIEDDQAHVLDAIHTCTIDDPISKFECRVSRENKIYWQEWTIRGIFDQNGELKEYQCVGRDTTERKEMEKQLQSAHSILAQNTRLSSIGQLASSVAHQISNPLTTIIAEAQLLSHSLVKDKENFESAEQIIKAGWRAQYVIQELMMFSETPKNKLEILDINETIQKAILLSGALIQASGKIQLVVKLSEDLPHVEGNLQQLEDLWISMLLLAKEATADDQPHIIRVQSSPSKTPFGVNIAISDNGLPISDDEIDEIFEPKLIPAGIGRGSGIELSICREIVRQHKGVISVVRDKGFNTFNIFLPGELKHNGTN